MSEKDGGQAFPLANGYTPSKEGMTLRDYFAAAALPAVYAASIANFGHDQASIVAEAYELADTMLEERAK